MDFFFSLIHQPKLSVEKKKNSQFLKSLFWGGKNVIIDELTVKLVYICEWCIGKLQLMNFMGTFSY